MSAAQTINPAEESSPLTNNSVPTDIEGDPITFDGNPAHAEGVCQEIIDCIMRTGKFKMLVVKHAVPAGYKTAVDSAQAIPFLRGDITDHSTIVDPAGKGYSTFDASRPCPPTPLRQAAYTAGGGKHAFATDLTPALAQSYVVSPDIIESNKLALANWILQVNEDADVKTELFAASNGDGCELLRVGFTNLSKDADSRDFTLVVSRFKNLVGEGHAGPVSAKSFGDWWKRLKKARIGVPRCRHHAASATTTWHKRSSTS